MGDLGDGLGLVPHGLDGVPRGLHDRGGGVLDAPDSGREEPSAG